MSVICLTKLVTVSALIAVLTVLVLASITILAVIKLARSVSFDMTSTKFLRAASLPVNSYLLPS